MSDQPTEEPTPDDPDWVVKTDPADIVPEEETITAPSKVRRVRYSGRANSRSLSASDLKSLGIKSKSKDGLVWDTSNDFTVHVDDIGGTEAVKSILALPGFTSA